MSTQFYTVNSWLWNAWTRGYLVSNGSTTQEGVSWGSGRAVQLSELFYDAASNFGGVSNQFPRL